MKKLLLFLGITIFIFGLTTVALAGGYNPYDDQLNQKYTVKPHGDGSGSFYNNSTNFCKTCHAVHLAGEPGYKPGTLDPLGDTWRLLRATSPEDACDYCHRGAGAHTNKIVYEVENPKGEHTLGATVIPDSNLNNPNGTTGTFAGGGGLTCNRCHSVHGSKIMFGFQGKILRIDPAFDGYGTPATPEILPKGIPAGDASAEAYWEPIVPGNSSYDGTLIYRTFLYYSGDDVQINLFCADCHNLNMNWTDGSGIPDPSKPPAQWLKTDPRLNPHSHPINPDAQMAVNGQNIWVADSIASFTSCRGCHSAFTASPFDPGNRLFGFPHQSRSHKLLFEGYENLHPEHPDPADPWYTGDPQRQLPNMDTICLGCHGGYVGVEF